MKKIKKYICLVCAVALMLSALVIPTQAVDGKSVTATTSASLKQGGGGTFSVYIDSLENLAALDVTVHFDATKIKVNSIYNSATCTLYDSA